MVFRKITEVIMLMRVAHWSKNAFIFLPLFFSGKITDASLLVKALVAFIAYSLAASAVYILNDWRDIERDRLHPEKQKRPLASGAIKSKPALIFAVFCIIVAFAICIFIIDKPWATIILTYYVVQNILYSFWFKHYAIVDVTIIAIGFVLRILIGGVVTGIELSHWIVILTFLLSLFLAFGKRRDDVVVLETTNNKLRKSLDGYNLTFIDISMCISGTIVMVAYLMYSLSPEIIDRLGEHIYVTAFFVFLGILQYLRLTLVHQNSSNPVKLLFSNLFLQLIILCWIGSYVVIIYFESKMAFLS